MQRPLILISLALTLACEPAAPPAHPAPAHPSPAHPALGADAIAFVDVSVLPLDAERVLASHTVVVSGGKIVAMGPTKDTAVPLGVRVIDGRSRFLMPGLADMHVHLTREEDLALYVAQGVTAVRNMWGAPLHLSWRDRIRKGEIVGPAIYTSGPIVDGIMPVHDGSIAMKGADDAAGVIAFHQQAGYDFVKIYSRLSAPAFEGLVSAAKAAGLPVAGHVPREVGLARVLDAGVTTVEHLNSFDDALLVDGSPLAGKYDGASRDLKIDFVDPAKIPLLARQIRDRGTWFCPTRNLFNQRAPADEINARLARPEMRYVPGYERAIWTSGGAPPADMRARLDRTSALGDELIRAIRDGGGRLLVGTDTGNPMVIPGYTLHEELELFVKAGLSPYEVLRTATLGAAELMRAEGEVGTVAVGKRADLLLLGGNPLTDIKQTNEIAGVMVRGRYYGDAERAALLSRVEAWAQGRTDPFAGLPALPAEGEQELAATYVVLWKGVVFDHERVLVERAADGRRLIHAQTIDPHKGQWMTMLLWVGDGGLGQRLILDVDGANGRGRVEVTRAGAKAHIRGTLLSGLDVEQDEELAEGTRLGADHFLATKILLSAELMRLEVGQSVGVHEGEVALGSYAKLKGGPATITRTADALVAIGQSQVAARRYEIAAGKGQPNVLWLDEGGWPVAYDITSHGVSFRRLENSRDETRRGAPGGGSNNPQEAAPKGRPTRN